MKKNRSIIYSTLQVTIITVLIKMLGLVKQSVLASICGATNETDIFFIVTGVLVSLSSIIFSAISISLLTFYTNRLAKEGRQSANRLINATLRSFLPIAILISIFFCWFSKDIGHVLAPSYNDKELVIMGKYIKLMSVSFVFWCYYLIINVILENDKCFLPGRLQGLFQNLFIIIGATFFYRKYGIVALIYAFVLSGLCQCIVVTWCARNDFKFIFTKLNEIVSIKKMIKLSLPLIIGNAIYEINDIVDKQISSGLGPGNASFLTYGSTINDIVAGVIVASVSVVLFSHFATWVAENKNEEVEKSLKNVLCLLTIIIYPVMVMCIVSGDQIVDILYGRGNFGEKEILATSGVVCCYALGFIFQAMRVNIVKVYYAYQDTKTPMINGIVAIAINIVLSVCFSRYIGIAGVALATSIAMLVITIMLGRGIRKFLPKFNFKEIFIECFKGLLAAVLSGGFVYIFKFYVHLNKYLNFILEGMICLIVYSVILCILKSNSFMKILFIGKREIKSLASKRR